jgi:hypothetical protein
MKRTRNQRRALVYALTAVGVILSAAGAVQAFYEHPTYGRGLQALLAVISAGRYL